jgi:hypothetical protein
MSTALGFAHPNLHCAPMRSVGLIFFLCAATFLSLNNLFAASEIIPHTSLVIHVPAQWQVDKTVKGALFVLRSPMPATLVGDAGERARGSVAVVTQSVTQPGQNGQSEGPIAFAVRCRCDLERTATGLVLDSARERKFAGQTWTEQPYRMQVGQFIFRQIMLTAVINGQGICLTLSSEDAHFAQHTAAFEAIIASLSRSSLRIGDE